MFTCSISFSNTRLDSNLSQNNLKDNLNKELTLHLSGVPSSTSQRRLDNTQSDIGRSRDFWVRGYTLVGRSPSSELVVAIQARGFGIGTMYELIEYQIKMYSYIFM